MPIHGHELRDGFLQASDVDQIFEAYSQRNLNCARALSNEELEQTIIHICTDAIQTCAPD